MLHHICDICGHPMITRQCKIICLNCGYRWDCSDLTLQADDAPDLKQPLGEQVDRQQQAKNTADEQ
jgi:uncharacterized Zn finger protein (UPF0148 family)